MLPYSPIINPSFVCVPWDVRAYFSLFISFSSIGEAGSLLESQNSIASYSPWAMNFCGAGKLVKAEGMRNFENVQCRF
jgi:hypothetical protein